MLQAIACTPMRWAWLAPAVLHAMRDARAVCSSARIATTSWYIPTQTKARKGCGKRRMHGCRSFVCMAATLDYLRVMAWARAPRRSFPGRRACGVVVGLSIESYEVGCATTPSLQCSILDSDDVNLTWLHKNQWPNQRISRAFARKQQPSRGPKFADTNRRRANGRTMQRTIASHAARM